MLHTQHLISNKTESKSGLAKHWLKVILTFLTAIVLLSACVSTTKSTANPVKQAANQLRGQHINQAIAIFGSPTYHVPASKSGGSAMWENSIISQRVVQRFVQTGTEYAGQAVVGQTHAQQGGHNTTIPIYQNQYRPTGYYQAAVEDYEQYVCTITALTDSNDLISNILVIGCKDSKDGW